AVLTAPAEDLGQRARHLTPGRIAQTFVAAALDAWSAAPPRLVNDLVNKVAVDGAHGLVGPALHQPAFGLDRLTAAGQVVQPQDAGNLLPAPDLGPRVLLDELAREKPISGGAGLLALDAAAVLIGSAPGHDVDAQLALAMNLRRERAGGRQGEGLAQHWLAFELLAREAGGAKGELGAPAVRSSEPQCPRSRAGRLNDEVQPGGAGIGYLPAP